MLLLACALFWNLRARNLQRALRRPGDSLAG